ncbi:MAG: beta-glucanase precursor, partial [Bacteroidetes bacterium]|nr:beta-glucanase precursor [Bacteroidota bacterium]
LFVIGCLHMLPQGFNTAFHSYNDYALNIIKINNKVYFSSEVNIQYPDSAYITSVNYNGQQVFKKGIKKVDYTHINKLLPTLDKKICFIGFGMGCDYIDNSQRTFIIKMDTLGSIVFDNTFSNLYSGSQNDPLVDVVQLPDSSFYCISDSSLFHFNKNGVLIKRKNTGFTKLCTIINYGSNKLLLSGKVAGINKHILIDTNGVTILSKPSFGPAIKYLKLSSGNIISLNNARLTKINATLDAIDSSVVSQGNTSITDFDMDQDTIFSIGSFSPSYNYIKFDSSFINTYQFSTSIKGILPAGIISYGNNIALLSNSTNTVNSSNQFIALTSFNKSGNFIYSNDIGVINVTVDSSNVSYSNSPPGYTQYTGGYRLKVTVKNFGAVSVQQFYLNHYIAQAICGKVYYHPLITMPLAPGATVSITTPFFNYNVLYVVQGPPSAQTFTLNNMCVYTTIPNKKNDADFSNDASCTNIVFYTNSIEKHTLLNSEVIVSPNPFNNNIKITADYLLQQIEVFSGIGQLIKHFSISEKQAELKLEGIPAGIYFLKIYSEKGTIIKKVVKK